MEKLSGQQGLIMSKSIKGKTMKVNPVNTTMPQPRRQGQSQQPSKPKPRAVNDDFKKVFEAEIKKRYGDKVASKVIFI